MVVFLHFVTKYYIFFALSGFATSEHRASIRTMRKLFFTRFLIASLIAAGVCGCSAASRECMNWQRQGLIVSSLEACEQCVETLGSGNRDAIQGCAIGFDASRLMQ